MPPNFAFEADAVRQRIVSCGVRAPRGSTRRWVAKMINQRAGIAVCLACWASVAHAHGEGAVLLALSIALAVLVIPFAIFLVFWRSIIKNKIILFCAYALTVVVAFYTAFSVIEVLPNDYAFFGILFGLPLTAWLVGVLLLRSGATQQGAPVDAPKAARH